MDLYNIIYSDYFRIACTTEEEAYELCEILYEEGYQWSSGKSLKDETHYKRCTELNSIFQNCEGIIYICEPNKLITYSGYYPNNENSGLILYKDIAQSDFNEDDYTDLNCFLDSFVIKKEVCRSV